MMANRTDLTPEQREARQVAELFRNVANNTHPSDSFIGTTAEVQCISRALLAAQDEVAMWRKAVEEMEHEKGCAWIPVEYCGVCGLVEYVHTGGRCPNAPEYSYSPKPPIPCTCIKSRLEKV